MKKNKGFVLPGTLMLLAVIMISLQGATMFQMSEIKYQGKIIKDLKSRIEIFNQNVGRSKR